MICVTSGYLNNEAFNSSEEILGTLLRKAAKLKILSVVKWNICIGIHGNPTWASLALRLLRSSSALGVD